MRSIVRLVLPLFLCSAGHVLAQVQPPAVRPVFHGTLQLLPASGRIDRDCPRADELCRCRGSAIAAKAWDPGARDGGYTTSRGHLLDAGGIRARKEVAIEREADIDVSGSVDRNSAGEL